jgi:hypothetical protein
VIAILVDRSRVARRRSHVASPWIGVRSQENFVARRGLDHQLKKSACEKSIRA